jgi:hypothetical protein
VHLKGNDSMKRVQRRSNIDISIVPTSFKFILNTDGEFQKYIEFYSVYL